MNTWDEVTEQSHEGALLEIKKGVATADDLPIAIGRDGLLLAMLMATTILGELLFDEDGKLVGSRLGRVEDGFTPAKKMPEGWVPSTQVTGVGWGDANRGRILTLRSTSWGARMAFLSLAASYKRFNQQLYPVVYLDTAERLRSGNHVIDPVFTPVEWVPRAKFESPKIASEKATPQIEKPASFAKAEQTVTSGREEEVMAPARPIDSYTEEEIQEEIDKVPL